MSVVLKEGKCLDSEVSNISVWFIVMFLLTFSVIKKQLTDYSLQITDDV